MIRINVNTPTPLEQLSQGVGVDPTNRSISLIRKTS
jgi:hypothetical protein